MKYKRLLSVFLFFALILSGVIAIFQTFTLDHALSKEKEDTISKAAAAEPLTSVGTPAGIKEEYKKIALTFDDGPHPCFTGQLLDGLKERQVVATFFVTGENASLHPELIRRMHEEGHLIGNHTYSHIQLTEGNLEEFREELVKTNNVIKQITGEEVMFVRPPYGIWKKELERDLNMIPVLWNIDPRDWCDGSASCVAYKVLQNVEENDIILLHDYYKSSIEAAFLIVDQLKEQGYIFVTVDEILLD